MTYTQTRGKFRLEIQVTLADEAAICRAFEIAGIEFIEDNDGGRKL